MTDNNNSDCYNSSNSNSDSDSSDFKLILEILKKLNLSPRDFYFEDYWDYNNENNSWNEKQRIEYIKKYFSDRPYGEILKKEQEMEKYHINWKNLKEELKELDDWKIELIYDDHHNDEFQIVYSFFNIKTKRETLISTSGDYSSWNGKNFDCSEYLEVIKKQKIVDYYEIIE